MGFAFGNQLLAEILGSFRAALYCVGDVEPEKLGFSQTLLGELLNAGAIAGEQKLQGRTGGQIG